jgi:hypothetical protein
LLEIGLVRRWAVGGRGKVSQKPAVRLRDGARISKSGDDVQARSKIFNPVGKITTAHVMTLDCFSHQQSSAVISCPVVQHTPSHNVCMFFCQYAYACVESTTACLRRQLRCTNGSLRQRLSHARGPMRRLFRQHHTNILYLGMGMGTKLVRGG